LRYIFCRLRLYIKRAGVRLRTPVPVIQDAVDCQGSALPRIRRLVAAGTYAYNPAALRVYAIVLVVDWKTGENDCEKDDKTDQPEAPGGNFASDQADQTIKRN
jgi:hypothetical protein